jgi:hypothetical protein
VWSTVYDRDRVLSELDSRYSAPQGSMYRAFDGPNSISTNGTEMGSWTERWSQRESLQRAMDASEVRSEGTVSQSSLVGESPRGAMPRGGGSSSLHYGNTRMPERGSEPCHWLHASRYDPRDHRGDYSPRELRYSSYSYGSGGGGGSGLGEMERPKSSWSRFSNSDYRSLGQAGYGGFGI